jgi:ATP-dependent DNA helicase RecG
LGLQHFLFDAKINSQAVLEKVLSQTVLERYCKESQIPFPLSSGSLLENLNAAKKLSLKDDQYLLTNAGVLLFTESPKKYLPESYLTVVRYQGDDRFSIADRQELDGDLLQQINDALSFVKRNITVNYEISGDARRVERYEYSLVAVREALINAVTHRDYSFQNSCTYLNIYANRLEIENPGGIYGGISVEDIEGRSIRRNPTLSDLLFRAGYGEKLGSGLLRIKESLAENSNPPYQIASTNFFSIRFFPRIARSQDVKLTLRQLEILSYIRACKRELSASELALHLGVSTTSISRDMKALLAEKLILRHGTGKLIRYVCL